MSHPRRGGSGSSVELLIAITGFQVVVVIVTGACITALKEVVPNIGSRACRR